MGAGSRKRILIVDNSTAITGAIKAIVNSVSHLKTNFDFIFVLPKNSKATDFVKNAGFEVFEIPFLEISKRTKVLFLYLPYLIINSLRLKRICSKKGIDIIHMNDFYNLTGVVAKKLGTKANLVTHVRFMPQKFIPVLSKIWSEINLAHANKIICVSEAVKKYFAPNDKVIVIPDPIPEKENHPKKVISKSDSGLVKLLYLSNFIRGKGQDAALKAFADAFKQNPNLRLKFVGGDMGLEKNKAFKQELIEIVKSKQLDEAVDFQNFTDDVETEIKKADILLNFSESESFSLTCLDALYYGTPLIATDSGGPSELFEHGKSGFLIKVGEVDAMKVAILKLADSIELQAQFSEEGARYVRNKFGAKESYMKLYSLYQNFVLSNDFNV